MYLNCHTYFSLRYGVLGVKNLVQQASVLKHSSLALTDINNTSCTIEFVNCCKEHGINPVVGIEFRDEQDFLYIGLAHDRTGFAQLNLMLNRYLVEGQALPRRAPMLPGVSFIYDCRQVLGSKLDLHEYAGVRPNQIHHWYKWQRHVPADRSVAWMPVTLGTKRDWSTHQMLRCIALGTIASKISSREVCQPDEYMRSPSEVDAIYQAYPHLVTNGRRLLSQCVFDHRADALLNKQYYLDSFYHDQELLTHLSLVGLQQRYPAFQPHYIVRLQNELEMIFRLRFEAYFLIAWDIIEYARKAGYRHVGRGSGANSLVAYCLHITDVDPIALNLYFERFINPHRPVPPDFDLDFSWDERDDVIQYIQKRFGHKHVGLLASYQTFKGKSVVREVGKVLGLSRKEIDLIVQYPRAHSRHHPLAAKIFREGKHLLGMPSHLSIHSGGIVITESGLHHLTASQMMPKGLAITQMDMHHAAAWGLHKFDILSQRGTGHINEAVQLIQQHKGTRIDIGHMPMVTADQKTFELLRTPGGCIGCFYIESPAMRGLLTKVPCHSYPDLVAVSSIIRPGVAKSGMMQEYIERFHDSSRITHIDPQMADLLQDTFGIMVYQEDVMKVVHHLANFSLYESDLLRRLMTGKQKTSESLQYLKDRFFTNCLRLGRSERVVSELWRQIESFSGYAFCKAHSATYAAESLQSLFLKAHYPIEFMVAVINNEGGYYPMEVYVRELVRLGGKVEAPCIIHSSWNTRIEQGKVYLGLKMIKGLTMQTGGMLAELREQKTSMNGMKQLISIMSPTQIDLLIEAGALRSIDPERYRLFFERLLQSRVRHPIQLPLFDPCQYVHKSDIQDDPSSLSRAHLRLLGFTIESPYLLFDSLPQYTIRSALSKKIGTSIMIIGYYILEKPVTTEHGAHMCFVTWYDRELAFFDSVHFPGILDRYPLAGKGFYRVVGSIQMERGYPLLIAKSCHPLKLRKDLEDDPQILNDNQYLSETDK